jgi:hypothetical protein
LRSATHLPQTLMLHLLRNETNVSELEPISGNDLVYFYIGQHDEVFTMAGSDRYGAIALFNEDGFHAPGIEMILAKVRMSKKTLYIYFCSKEELVLAALRHYDSLFRDDSMVKVEKASPNVEGRLLAISGAAEAWFSEEKDVNPNSCQAGTAQASHQDMLARPVPCA